jgi:hypothetical protein
MDKFLSVTVSFCVILTAIIAIMIITDDGTPYNYGEPQPIKELLDQRHGTVVTVAYDRLLSGEVVTTNLTGDV